MLETNFTTPALGHVFSSIRAISPSETITKRLNSMEAIVFYKATEENVEDSIVLCNFEKLINPTPFKNKKSPKRVPPPKRMPAPVIPRFSATQVAQKFLPYEREISMDSQPSRTTRLSKFSRARTLSHSKNEEEAEKAQVHGILKKGPKSRFAHGYERASSLRSENSNTSRVTIVE